MTPSEIIRQLSKLEPFDLFARMLFGECRGEILRGQVAVANVAMNRLNDPRKRYGRGLTGVLLRPWAFSCFNASDPNLGLMLSLPNGLVMDRLRCLAALAEEGLVVDITQGSTLYFNPSVTGGWPKRWDRNRCEIVGLIGRHVFVREL